ncbi:hypothetical protein VRRI112168_06500 [Vreelandella rituensis]|uniref:Uncharacterized protein n=1 Tax=Vreelandella rituensis TaxID=2282306 RepID=A0A368U7R7_9GAMM|nr:hypothetical protein [Halomonas rituensis]RCV93219.1 hypothetical protein DU506_03690 [Halomonas rituensis]
MSHSPPHAPISFRAAALRTALYVLLVGAIAQGAYLEALYFPGIRFSEWGFTEFTQTLFLASSCVLLLYIRQGLKVWPNVTLLILAFLAASLVREQDAFLDTYVADNTWKVLVALIILPSLYWVGRNWHRFLDEFSYFGNSLSFGLFMAGLLVTYVFSRLYGRQDFWRAVLEDDYVRDFKNVAEEVVELMGYALILIAVIELLIMARRQRLANT